MKIRVLLVDDEKDYINALSRQLTVRNYDVTSVYSGDDAIREIDSRDYDVVVLDVLMPEKDGIETYKELKKRNSTAQVIMHTGHARLDTAMDGLQDGIFDYVIKPVSVDELTEKIDLACKKKKVTR